ncbi:hypothetical protein Nans01_19040 [Nocardiopsis ansamitocini]|uniref:Uncharacterized protein n=1 Tax=Nocardiopsis ansamitocini TaxID=1670832 RepID=A0A9W6UIL3_9ACTN|nr:hypothetical protein Nans01_19040 [Nocardiopsis ansamitocini]
MTATRSTPADPSLPVPRPLAHPFPPNRWPHGAGLFAVAAVSGTPVSGWDSFAQVSARGLGWSAVEDNPGRRLRAGTGK